MRSFTSFVITSPVLPGVVIQLDGHGAKRLAMTTQDTRPLPAGTHTLYIVDENRGSKTRAPPGAYAALDARLFRIIPNLT